MAGYLKYILISLIVISLSAKFFLIPLSHGLWWDETVYLTLGRNLQNGFYSLDAGRPLETFRAPVFPLLVSLVSDNITLSRMLVALISVISVVLVYFLSRELFGREVALWASLFLSTNQLFIFFTTKTLTEPLFISFLSLSLIFFLRRKGNVQYALLSGVFSGLAFLTRYLGTILIISYILYFIYLLSKRKGMKGLMKEFVVVFAGILFVLSPWFLLSYVHYGNIFGAYTSNILEYSDQGRMFSEYFTNVMQYSYFNDIFQAFGLQIVFVILGFYLMLKKGRSGERILLIIIFLLPLIFFSLDPYRQPRYLLSYLPVYAIFSAFALRHKFKISSLFPLLAVLICIFSMLTGFVMAWDDRDAANGLIQGSLYIKDLTGENDYIMSQSYPYIYYLSERRAIVFPVNTDDLKDSLNEKNIKYVLLYKFEPKNPDYVEDYFDKSDEFVLIKKFEQWEDPDAVRIYEFVS
ncbi:MAG: phospholipid carrier-dependent glycosyltransferase [Candidatus Aenigmarchaeota archaeon]|nr:phospholipid carrier-dependent glycosyltransferase [Candidatus Aenigmarchaeota archaeon]NIQ17775.1 phospholipid carrier-dependent glycosyltransferase [Candidatus Aenigmarchaeota archaeon]NIS73095.1 phospholipid carrier-dependent glycosyltransferase [Candidatus Aenigmarchaeota archaeon]